MGSTIHPPPRVLLGATLLFWGAMTSRPLLGLFAAIIVEAANWIRFRWRFERSACSLAWRVSMSLIIISGILIWLDGNRYTALPKLLTWLPILLLPLQFVQSYGLAGRMPLNAFSFFSKLHRERNLRLGLADSIIHFNFGNPYFIATIIAATLGENAHQIAFLPGLVILGGWLVISRIRIRPLAIISILIFATMIGAVGQKGLGKLYDWATNRAVPGGYPTTDPTESKTSIGSLGRLKQSPEMLWRLRVPDGTRPPSLLRIASYNRYKGINWRNIIPESATTPNPGDDDFRRLDTRELTPGEPFYMLREHMTPRDLLKPLPSFEIRGASDSEAPLPLPGDTSSVQRFELDGIEINPLGTVRVFPKRPIISGTVRWDDSQSTESPPFSQDLAFDSVENDTASRFATELGLASLPSTRDKINRLRSWFATDFSYTRYLTIPRARATRPSAIETFLTTTRHGHCEYFATSAALILRAAGVPTRYAVGFAVKEKDPERGEWIVRGLHGHAWVRVWDEQSSKWMDFDPTPAGWLGDEIKTQSENTTFADTWQRFKEDFYLWRNQPDNRLAATIVMWTIGLAILAFTSYRLWKSRLAVPPAPQASSYSGASPRTPLHELEIPARRLLGPRPPGTTYTRWLARLPEFGIHPGTLFEAIDLHQQARFDPSTSPSSHIPRLKDLVASIRTSLRSPPDTNPPP